MNADEPLRPGDPVTLVLPDHTVMVEVDSSTRLDFTVKLSSRGEKTYTSRWRLDEEGIGWLRGYHLANSPEVAACRTAQALGSPDTTTGTIGPDLTGAVGQRGALTAADAKALLGSTVVGGGSGNLNEEEIKKLFEKFTKADRY